MTTSGKTPVTKIRIEGMSCGHCVRAVSEALAQIPGLAASRVEVGRAVVDTADPDRVRMAVAAIREAGFEASADAVRPPTPGGCRCCNSEVPGPTSSSAPTA